MPVPDTTIDPAPANQASASAAAASQAVGIPAGLVEMHRLTAAMQKIEQLTLANRTLADQNSALITASGQMSAQISTLEAEHATKASEHTKVVGEYQTREGTYKAASLADEKLKRKLKAIQASGRPELLAIIDVLPEAETDEAQALAIKSIADFATQQAKARETQLTSGITHTEVVPQVAGFEAPTTDEGWSQLLNKYPLGSEERGKVTDQWYAFLNIPK